MTVLGLSLVLLALSPLMLRADDLPLLEQVKPLHLPSELVTDGVPRALLVAPTGAAWQPATRAHSRARENSAASGRIRAPSGRFTRGRRAGWYRPVEKSQIR